MGLPKIISAQIFPHLGLFVRLTLLLTLSIQALSSDIRTYKYPRRDYAVVNRVYELRDNVKSLLHCTSQCLSTFGSKCRAVAYSEDVTQGNCIIISTRAAVTGRVNISSNYTLYSTGTCASGYKLNPNTGTCVGLIDSLASWNLAKWYCEMMGEHLVTLPTIQDARWLDEQRLSNPGWLTRTWIGGNQHIIEHGKPWYWVGRINELITYRAQYWDPFDIITNDTSQWAH